MGVCGVRLNRSAQSGSARQVLQSLQGVGQTRVMGDMVHMMESCVNDFWALSTASATLHFSLNLSLRHEAARLIVWHAVSTRPVVPSTVSYEEVREGNDPYRALGHGTHSSQLAPEP